MYQLNDMAFYMLHLLRIKASVNIFNVNIKLNMPPMKRMLNMKDSHQQSILCYLPSKRLKTNDEDKKINPFPKRQILDSSKLKEFTNDNLNFDENVRKFLK